MRKLILLGIVGILKEGENVMNIRNIFITIVVLVSFVFIQIVGMPSSASARWRRNADQNPGTMEGRDVVVYGVVGAIVVIGIAFLIGSAIDSKNKKTEEGEKGGDDQLKKETEPDATDSPGSENILLKNMELSRLEKGIDSNKKQTRVEPFVGLQTDADVSLYHDNAINSLKDKTVVMGLTVNF